MRHCFKMFFHRSFYSANLLRQVAGCHNHPPSLSLVFTSCPANLSCGIKLSRWTSYVSQEPLKCWLCGSCAHCLKKRCMEWAASYYHFCLLLFTWLGSARNFVGNPQQSHRLLQVPQGPWGEGLLPNSVLRRAPHLQNCRYPWTTFFDFLFGLPRNVTIIQVHTDFNSSDGWFYKDICFLEMVSDRSSWADHWTVGVIFQGVSVLVREDTKHSKRYKQ